MPGSRLLGPSWGALGLRAAHPSMLSAASATSSKIVARSRRAWPMQWTHVRGSVSWSWKPQVPQHLESPRSVRRAHSLEG